jgi:hypothetical protein
MQKPPSLLQALLTGWGSKKPTKPALKPTGFVAAFQALSIQPGTQCCPTAKRIAGIRFLQKNLLALPLSGCTRPGGCTCRYVKHADRRVESRRLDDVGLKSQLFAAKERRSLRDRRRRG